VVNTYSYVDGNPTNRSDLLGLDWLGDIKRWWDGSVAAFQADSLGDTISKALQGLSIPSENAAFAGIGLIKKLDSVEQCVAGVQWLAAVHRSRTFLQRKLYGYKMPQLELEKK
jgi:hypothetical protein